MKDLLPKKSSIIIWIIVGLLFCINRINAQQNYTYDDYKYTIGAFQVQPEVVPYSLVLSEEVGYGCWLEIEIIEPISIKHLDQWTREEIKDLLIKRAAFEEYSLLWTMKL